MWCKDSIAGKEILGDLSSEHRKPLACCCDQTWMMVLEKAAGRREGCGASLAPGMAESNRWMETGAGSLMDLTTYGLVR